MTGRPRLGLALALAAVVAAGLLSRRYPPPGILAEYTGDASYAAAAFFACALVRPRSSTLALALLAFALSVAVECSQLIRSGILADLRATSFGRLLLGQGFKWADLVAYAIGSVVAAGVDKALWRAPAGR